MQIALDPVLLRGLVREIVLRPGALLGARVLERNGAHGLLMLAGAPVVAELPDGVAAGTALRLRVREVGADRILLAIEPDGASAAPAGQAAAPAPDPSVAAWSAALPGGAQARVLPDGGGGGRRSGRGGGVPGVTLRYDGAAIGRLDARIERGAIAIHLPAGAPADAARAALAELREALGPDVQVTIHPRGTTLDARA